MSGSGSSWPPRELGRIEGARPGPLLVCVGGVHGNEPGGVLAAERFLLRERSAAHAERRGRVVFLVGNRRALRDGVRYVDVDLNRLWGASTRGEPAAHEMLERRELYAAIEAQRADGPWTEVVLLDLHSTSGEGPPFAILADTLANRRLAESLPIPILLGLEERVDGTLLAEFVQRGERSLCVEGGVNGAERTVDAHEATIRIVCHELGIVPATDDELADARTTLARHAGDAPRWSRLSGLYKIDLGEDFRMVPGFKTFDRVRAGQLLAHGGEDGTSPILAPKDARLVMPRYQGQGGDGFFLAEELPAWWRPLSRALRRAGLRDLVRGLFHELDGRGSVLVAPASLARSRRQLLALLGYHVASSEGGSLRLRRRFDPSFDRPAGKFGGPGASHPGNNDRCAS